MQMVEEGLGEELMSHFGCAMRGTQFLREANGTPSPGASETFVRLKVVWDRISNQGCNGYQVYLNGPRGVIDSLVENRPLDMTPESSMVVQGAEPMPEARPALGVTAGFVARENVTVPGPVMELAVVHDPDGVSHSTESRTQPTCDSGGEPRKFKPSSPAGKRLITWFGALMNAVDIPRIVTAFLDLYADKQLGEVASGAFVCAKRERRHAHRERYIQPPLQRTGHRRRQAGKTCILQARSRGGRRGGTDKPPCWCRGQIGKTGRGQHDRSRV